MKKKQLSEEDHAALEAAAYVYGRYWKRRLWECWWKSQIVFGVTNETNRTLRQLRNASYFGPEGLTKYRRRRNTNES